MAAGAVALASLSDKKVDTYVNNHPSSAMRAAANFGKLAPFLAVGGAVAAFGLGDDRLKNTALVSMQAAVLSAGAGEALKVVINRARPSEDRGAWAQSANRLDSSFPSIHSVVNFATVTPFAKEYDMPWLYTAAAVGSLGRVAGREHWFSDVVASGFLGYATASWLWSAQRDSRPTSRLAVVPGVRELNVAYQATF